MHLAAHSAVSLSLGGAVVRVATGTHLREELFLPAGQQMRSRRADRSLLF